MITLKKVIYMHINTITACAYCSSLQIVHICLSWFLCLHLTMHTRSVQNKMLKYERVMNRLFWTQEYALTEVTPLATARINLKPAVPHFSIISCTCCALAIARIIGILCHHEIRVYLIYNPPKHAFNPQQVHNASMPIYF